MPYSPIHDDDICAQLEPLLDAATRAGDDRELGRRRAGERAGVVRATSASCSASTPTWSSTEIPGASGRLGRRPHEAQRRSPARAGSAGATGSAAWREHLYPDRVPELTMTRPATPT